MFDLEKSIAQWRHQMLAAGIKTAESLDELENHLREEFEAQIKLGQKPEQAFEIAVEQIGRPAILEKEFAKVDGPWPVWQKLRTLLGLNKIPSPLLEDFAPVGKQTLELAAGEARNFQHNFIGTEHILLGLLKSESTIVSKVMRSLGVEEKTVRIEIEKFFSLMPRQPVPEVSITINIPFTRRARNALHLAGNQARALNQSQIKPENIHYTPRAENAPHLAGNQARALNQPQIKPEHILLGLILEGDGIASRVLKNLGIQIENVRDEVLRQTGMAGS